MNDHAPEGTEGPSPSEMTRIAEACERFEAAWRRGEGPRIEDSLAAVGPDFDPLLEKILPLELSLRLAAGEAPTPDEYLSRFPGSRGVVEGAFAEQTTAADLTAAPPPPVAPPGGPPVAGAGPGEGPSGGSSYNLLIGILALQNGFIDHHTLIAAIQAWAQDKTRRLGAVLIRAGKLEERQLALLEALADEHRRRYGDDIHKSLAALGSLAPVFRAVEGMGDPDVESSLTFDPASTQFGTEATTARDEAEAGPWPDGEAPPGGPGEGWSSSRFEILSLHDAGQLGKVFIALDRELNRNVALKEIQEKLADHPVSRGQFVLEGIITGALEHPGIVPVYSMGRRKDGRPFYAMRFIQGPSLRDKLKQLHGDAEARPLAEGEAPPTLPRLLRHFVSACQAMAYAHSRGVLHRDLKPEHVLLGPFGETLVVDWGLAIAIPRKDGEPGDAEASLHLPPGQDSPLAQDGVIVGTVPYMSPEQARGLISQMGRTSDVYALGAVLYAVLTGRAPVAAGDFASILAQVRKGEFPRPRDVRRDVPPALEAVCLKAMAFDPAARYASAGDLACDVEHWLDDEPTVAYPEPWSVRSSRWLRRHSTAAVAAATLLVCALAGLAAMNLQARRANAAIGKERDLADAAREEAELNLRASLTVVDRMLLSIAAKPMPAVPEAVELRRKVADEAMALLDVLDRRHPRDLEVRFFGARVSRELATILRLLGQPTAAAYARAVGLLRNALADSPGDRKYRDLLAETLQDFAAALQAEGRPEDGDPLLREALEVLAGLRAQYPDAPDYRRTEARVANTLANRRLGEGDYAEAARVADLATRTMQKFADSDSPGPTDRMEAVMYQDTLGEALLEGGKLPEAATALDETVRRVDGLLEKAPTDQNLRFLKAAALMKRARALHGEGAKAAADAAVDGIDSLYRQYPKIVVYPEYLALALFARADQHLEREDLAGARADLERALEASDGLMKIDAGRPAYSALLGRAVGRLGLLDVHQGDAVAGRPRLERAAGLLTSALTANPKSPPDRRTLEEVKAALKTLPNAAP
ncbi:serine/threonine-protein kinase [Paludisphaera mucosa]|uniref:Serine/threonine-protein kinase n=1 Tax=Paludisphaera mucosa TaxID=3030827 RepID=A0ABT6FDB4_9BACT|nr:serine/threonine-protein kinase [Paludisphaera mucosa]MDG3005577.1 serine/threonine-protein kinase [Paludisphaera mucosa]